MKIAIISDTHDNIVRIDQMLKKIKKEKINTLIHCGDVCAPSVLKYLAEKFTGQIYLSLGNVDNDHEMMTKITQEELNNIQIFPQFGELEIDNLKLAFTHKPGPAKELAGTGKYNFVFYGHTHQPWEEKINSCLIVNPGTVAGLFSLSTFAILNTETKEKELILL